MALIRNVDPGDLPVPPTPSDPNAPFVPFQPKPKEYEPQEEWLDDKAERLVKEYEAKKPLEGDKELWDLARTIKEQIERFYQFQAGWDHMSDEYLQRLIDDIEDAFACAALESLPPCSSNNLPFTEIDF